ncbi:MAG: hypothetical protein PQJ50_18435 [Spirochaetales bacterium]|nr:hypothetical protein [Spirochaetales bacterium]
MKKIILLILFTLLASISLSSQALYFDIGGGIGWGVTKIADINQADYFPGTSQLAGEAGLKLGWGPVFDIPLYITGEFEALAHRFFDDIYYYQYNSFLIGPGVVFYPIDLLQLAATLGYSFTGQFSNIETPTTMGWRGMGLNISAAADLGSGFHGLLLGLKYTMISNTLESSAKEKQHLFSLFVKYAYRQKMTYFW